jgi:tetratricopeptide (TPR) repeat protein
MRLIGVAVLLALAGCGTAEESVHVTAGGRTAITAELAATTLIGENRCHDAIDTLSAALADIPGNARLLTLRGFCAYVLHDIPAARADLDRAAAIEPSYFYPLVVRGQIEADAGDIDAGMADLNRAITLAQDSGLDRMRLDDGTAVPVGTMIDTRQERAWALTLRAELFKRLGEVDPGTKDVEAALRLSPSYPDAWIVKASILRAADDYTGALEADRRALGLERSARVYREICFDQVALNRAAAAVRSCNAGLALEPGAPALLEARAVAYLKLYRFADAEADFDAALAIRPHWATLFYGRAIARAHLGQAAQAAQDVREARKLVPDIDHIFSHWGAVA